MAALSALAQEPVQAPAAAAPPRVENARDLLALLGLDAPALAGLADRQPVQPDELDLVLRTVLAVRRFSLADLEQFSLAEVPWSRLAESPREERGQAMRLAGRVVRADRLLLTEQQAEQFELSAVYRCELELGESAQPAVVFAERVPEAWKLGEPLDERVTARGIFLKTSADDPQRPTPVFVARRVGWHPRTVLGELGYDVGLLDGVRNQTALGLDDSEAFFAMLHAVGQVSGSELLRKARHDEPAQSLFPTSRPEGNRIRQEPPKVARGELIALVGTVIRCIEIKVESADLRTVYGLDHYYELELVNIDSQGNPITFCVRELPSGMPQGHRLSTDVRIAGFFFKTWTYRQKDDPRAAEPTPEGKLKFRIAPLLIGRGPVLLEPLESTNIWFHVAVGGLLVGLAAVAWVGVWWFNREDRQFSQRTIAKRFEPEAGKSLDDAHLDDRGPPDFSQLP